MLLILQGWRATEVPRGSKSLAGAATLLLPESSPRDLLNASGGPAVFRSNRQTHFRCGRQRFSVAESSGSRWQIERISTRERPDLAGQTGTYGWE